VQISRTYGFGGKTEGNRDKYEIPNKLVILLHDMTTWISVLNKLQQFDFTWHSAT
jgi:hypothetical protein